MYKYTEFLSEKVKKERKHRKKVISLFIPEHVLWLLGSNQHKLHNFLVTELQYTVYEHHLGQYGSSIALS